MRIGVGVLFLAFLIAIVSCKKKETSHSAHHTDSVSIDSSKLVTNENVAYVFYDSIPVYESQDAKEIIGYLHFGDSVVLEEGIGMNGNPQQDREERINITCKLNGKKKNAKAVSGNLAMITCRSHVDSELRYMGNLWVDKSNMTYLTIKMTRKNQLVDVFETEMGEEEIGFYLNLNAIDSLQFDGIDEILYINVYKPYGEFEFDEMHLGRRKDKIEKIIGAYGRYGGASGEYADYYHFYFPYSQSGKWIMTEYSETGAVRDSNQKMNSITIPVDYKGFSKNLIYIENIISTDSLDKKGRRVTDNDGNSVFTEVTAGRLWLKWNGSTLDTLTDIK